MAISNGWNRCGAERGRSEFKYHLKHTGHGRGPGGSFGKNGSKMVRRPPPESLGRPDSLPWSCFLAMPPHCPQNRLADRIQAVSGRGGEISGLGGKFQQNEQSVPVSVKFSPKTGGWFEGTELNFSFDGLVSSVNGGMRVTQFGDRLELSLRRAVFRRGGWSFALSPDFEFLLRGDRGARLGMTGIAVYAWGLNSLVGNFIWSTATQSSQTNPAQKYEVIMGYSRTLGEGTVSRRFSLFAEYKREMPSNSKAKNSLVQGMAYRVRPSLVLDIATSQLGVGSGQTVFELAAGLTVNLGRVQGR